MVRAIYTEKAFKRGLEYHIMNTLAILYMMFDTILGESNFCDPRSDEAMPDYFPQIEEMTTVGTGELPSFLSSYVTQVEALLHRIRATRQNNWKGFLTALDEQIKYFMAHDLFKYARLMPVHLAQMKALEKDDPLTWDALESGDICIRKSDTSWLCYFYLGYYEEIKAEDPLHLDGQTESTCRR